MRQQWLRRLLAVMLLGIPLSVWSSANARRTLGQIQTDPAGYLAHQEALKHSSLLVTYCSSVFLIGLAVVLVELLVMLLTRLWPADRPAA